MSVSPATASLQVSQTQLFTATVQGTGAFSTSVNWFVNDVAGGNASVGTVSSSGLYTAPSALQSVTVSVKATSVADPSKSGTASVTVTAPPLPTCTLTANPATITQGQSSSLSWLSANATSASLDQGIGSVNTSGSTLVMPSATTTYTLSVTGPGGAANCTATVSVNPPPLADFSVSTSQATAAVPANGSVFLNVQVNVASSGSTAFTIALSLGGLPQGVTASFNQTTLSPGGTSTLTLTAALNASAVSSFLVIITGTRDADGVTRTAGFSLDVTRIMLGGGENTYVFSGFSSQGQTCLAEFEQQAYASEKLFFGNPATTATITVQLSPGSGGGGFNSLTDTLGMSANPGANPDCRNGDAGFAGLYGVERKHSFKNGWFDLFPTTAPPYPAYEHVGLSSAATILHSLHLKETGTWNAIGQRFVAPNVYFLVSRMDQNVFSCVRDEGTSGSAVATSNWMFAAMGAKLFAAFQQAQGNVSDLTIIDHFRLLNEAEYQFVSQNQRLPTMAERIAIFGSVATHPIAGQDAISWLNAQPITCASGPDGTFWDIVAFSAPNPQVFRIPAIVQQGGTPDAGAGRLTRSPITSGTPLVRIIDANNNEAWRATFDFTQGQDFPFPQTNAQGQPFASGGYRIEAQWNGETRQNYTAIIPDSILRPNGTYRGIVAIFVNPDGSIAANPAITTDGIVEVVMPGAAIIRPVDTTRLPMTVTVNGKIIPVPPLRWWTTVGIIDVP